MRHTFSMLVFLHLLATRGILTSLSKSNHSEDSCEIYVNLRNAKSLILPTVSSMNDAGFQAKHIMFMSGHRCEASLSSLCLFRPKLLYTLRLPLLTTQPRLPLHKLIFTHSLISPPQEEWQLKFSSDHLSKLYVQSKFQLLGCALNDCFST